MIAAKSRRRRAKPHFLSELPIRTERLAADDPRFDSLLMTLKPATGFDLDKARKRLNNIASDLMNSRRIQANKPTRSDSNRTLKCLAERMERLLALTGLLEPHEIGALESRLNCCCLEKPEPGAAAIEALVEVVREIEDAAYGVMHFAVSNDGSAGDVLNSLHDQARIAALELEGLSLDTEWALIIMQQYVSLFPAATRTRSRWTATKDLIGRFARISGAAYAIETKQRGPRQDTAQSFAIFKLKEFYEETTGSAATHSTVSEKQYIGIAQSDFGKFVTGFMEVAEPDKTNRRGTHEAISYAVWPKRMSIKGKAVAAARAKREQQTLEYLKND